MHRVSSTILRYERSEGEMAGTCIHQAFKFPKNGVESNCGWCGKATALRCLQEKHRTVWSAKNEQAHVVVS